MSRAKYGQAGTKDKVWGLAKPIKGSDSTKYRQDPYGNKISYGGYGKSTSMGWQVDHIKPVSRNGSNDIRNLQALQSHVNMSKGDSLVKKSRHNG